MTVWLVPGHTILQYERNHPYYSMSVTIRLFAIFRERLGHSALYLETAPDETVQALWERVVAERPDLAAVRAVTRFAINGEEAAPDTPVRAGDEVAFLPPMSGGAME